MPRHDYDDFDDDDLIDYDDEYYEDDEMTPEEEEELMMAVSKVKSIIGNRKIKDDDIKDSIYDHDFDTDRASKQLIDKYDKANKPKPKAPLPKTTNQSTKSSKFETIRTTDSEQSLKHGASGPDEAGVAPKSKLAALAQARAQKRANSSVGSTISATTPSALYSQSKTQASPSPASSLASVSLLNKLSTPQGSSATQPTTSSNGGSALSKLARAREQQKSRKVFGSDLSSTGKSLPGSPSSPTKLTVASNESSIAKKSSSPSITTTANSKKRRTAPEVDYNIEIECPKYLRADPSSFGLLFCSQPRTRYSKKSKVANTVYLPTDDVSREKVERNFSNPSPDDVVQLAQEKGGFLEKGMSGLKIGSEPDVNSTGAGAGVSSSIKNVRKLNVQEEMSKNQDQRPSINFVVIGHVDAGKSTLMGRLLYDAGVIDQNTINKYKRESEKEGKGSFHLAWVLDQTSEERRRGVTMDICMSQFETSKAKFTIVDAPGHRDFVPNMIAGSSQADFAVLVVDSSTNAFESGFNLDGQTKEHAILVRSLGVDNMIVAVNKLDTQNWSKDRFEQIRLQLTDFLVKIGFKDNQVSFVPTSGLHGDNVTKKSEHKELQSWYQQGPTLLESLERSNNSSINTSSKDHSSDLRMMVSDVASAEHTSDITASGRIDKGSVQVGEQVYIAPSGAYAQVKALSVASNGNASRDWAIAGENVTLRLVNIEEENLKVGSVVCNIEAPVAAVNKFTTRVVVFDIKRPLLIGTKLVLHRGRTNEQCKISKIVATIDKTNGQVLKSKPRHLVSGQTAQVEITLEHALPMEVFKASKELGRIVLRKDGATVAAGIVDSVL